MRVNRDHGRDDGVVAPIRHADPHTVDLAGLETVLALADNQRTLLECQPDRIAGAACRHGMGPEGMSGPRNAACDLAAALARLHLLDNRSQDVAGVLRARVGRCAESAKSFRPIAE